MTKNELINYVAETTQRTKKEAETSVDAVLAGLSDALGRGEKADLRGFGNFQISERKERQGRNPQTGETITIAARKAVIFKPSKELTERVQGHAGEPSGGSAKMHGDKLDT